MVFLYRLVIKLSNRYLGKYNKEVLIQITLHDLKGFHKNEHKNLNILMKAGDNNLLKEYDMQYCCIILVILRKLDHTFFSLLLLLSIVSI